MRAVFRGYAASRGMGEGVVHLLSWRVPDVPHEMVEREAVASEIERFLLHKRALGRRYETEEYALRLFDRFLVVNQISSTDAITGQLIGAFLASRPRGRPRSG